MSSQTQQTPVLVELKPNRNLLDPNFNGYKLSLEKLPTHQVSVKTGVDRAQPSEQQYSLQHVKQFGVHNHIFSDSYNPFVVYIVDKLWTILRISIDFMTGRLGVISEVWRVPKPAKKMDGRFNVTISFPDNGHAVISDGFETLHVVKTGDRKSPQPWSPVMTLTPFTGKTSPQFCLLDSIMYKVGNDNFIDVLALRIDDKTEWTEVVADLNDNALSGHSFLTVLEWFTFQDEQAETSKWTLKGQRTLLGHSGTEYAYLEPGGTGIYLASESRFHVVADTEKPINLNANADAQTSIEVKKPEYIWSETMEEVKLWFRVPSNLTKRDVDVEFKRTSISVSHKGKPIFEGPLSKTISVEGSYWIIDTPKCLPVDAPETSSSSTPDIQGAGDAPDAKHYKVLEIVMEKVEKEVLWLKEVVTGNSCGEYVSDPELVEAIHSRLAHLCSDKWGADPGHSDAYDPRQLEECDEYPADSSCLMRIDKKLQKISHKASLGSHQWLFNVRLEAGKSPAICIRHDVDGLIWIPKLLSAYPPEPQSDKLENILWGCEHVGTFSALGYVQASKQQRKYTLCSSDISYVAICDAKKHIYVYRQPAKIESCLRNRRTGEQVTHVAKQLVISLDPPQDILGAYATPSYLYILSPENFHAIRILAEEE